MIGALSSAPAAANESTETGVAVEHVAMVRLQIRVGDRVVRAPVRAVPWGKSTTFVVDAGGRRHVVQLKPEKAGGRANVRMSYERDGAKVAADEVREVQPRRSTAIFADDGASIAVTIVPTRVSIAAQ